MESGLENGRSQKQGLPKTGGGKSDVRTQEKGKQVVINSNGGQVGYRKNIWAEVRAQEDEGSMREQERNNEH